MNWKYSTVVHNANVKWCYIILAFTILIVLTNPSVSSADILDQFGFFDFPSIFCVVLSFPYLYILHIDPYSNLLNLSFEALISHPLSWCLLARKFHWKKQRISIRIGFISSFHQKKVWIFGWKTYLIVIWGRSLSPDGFWLRNISKIVCAQYERYDSNPKSDNGFSGEPVFPSNFDSS